MHNVGQGNPQYRFRRIELPIRVFLVEDMRQMQGVLNDLLNVVGPFEIVSTMRTEAEANLWLQEHPGAWDVALIEDYAGPARPRVVFTKKLAS